MSRRRAAALLDVSQTYLVRRLDGAHLRVTREDGRVWYDRAEVEAFAQTFRRQRRKPRARVVSRIERRERGELAAQIFRLMDEGAGDAPDGGVRRCVVETHADPVLVREMIAQWHTSYQLGERLKREAAALAEAEKIGRAAQRAFEREAYFRSLRRTGTSAR